MSERTKTGSLKGIGGRPPGARNKTTLFKAAMREGFEKILQKEARNVFLACVDKAKEGDVGAMKLILDRVVPAAEVTKGGGGDRNITINVSGMTPSVVEIDSQVIDGESEEINE